MTLTEQRDALRRELSAADRRLAEAKRAIADEWRVNAQLLAPLWERRRRPQRATHWLREFSDDLLVQMKERGLAFDLSSADRSLTIFDPAAREELADAEEARGVAFRRLREFERKHEDALKAEADSAEAAGIRDALQGDDPAAIRRALAETA